MQPPELRLTLGEIKVRRKEMIKLINLPKELKDIRTNMMNRFKGSNMKFEKINKGITKNQRR